MKYNIFLDDERHPKNVNWVELPLVEWTIIRNYEQFTRHISTFGIPARVTFDHDLADEHYPWTPENQEAYKNSNTSLVIPYERYKEKTGYECARWLISYCMDRGETFPEYYVHTMNPIGKKNIISLIESYKKSLT